VVADHGASFIPGEQARAATAENLGGIAGVPLLIKAPGQRKGGVDDTPLETTDVLPTIAAELGVRIPWRLDGLAAAEVPDRRALTVVRDDGPPLTVSRIRLSELEAEALRSTLAP
jgi:arylsulfatase A-like enzyme